MENTRGFVTIATGNERYYRLARNLLCSYRQFSKGNIPFAIISDEHNRYTDEFDKTIIIKNPTNSFLDKLKLYEYLPYDETIFIDADSLAYGNLNNWWRIFENATDFSCFGYAWNLEAGRGWFIPSGIKEYQDKVKFVPDFNGGVYYLRRSQKCQDVFQLANYFANHYYEYEFTGFRNAADEPCLALAMAVYGCIPIDVLEGGICFAPRKKQIDADISVPKAHYYRNKNQSYNVNLIHWSNYHTTLSLYKFEVGKLNANLDQKGIMYEILYNKKMKYYFLCIANLKSYKDRIIRRIKRMLRK